MEIWLDKLEKLYGICSDNTRGSPNQYLKKRSLIYWTSSIIMHQMMWSYDSQFETYFRKNIDDRN